MAAGGFQHPLADFQNQIGVLGDGNEFRRRDLTVFGTAPAQQGFDAGDQAAAQIDLGLVVQGQFIALDGMAQGGFHLQVSQGLGIHRLVVECEGVAPGVLGAVHGGVGVLQQGVAILAILRVKADADARRDE